MTEVAVSKTPEPATDERAATGLQELDGMLEGGFLSGSLVTLTGRPGTGKTIFGSHFLHHGAKKGKQAGMYVSMLETEKLVIDSFTAMSPAFQTVGDLRTFTHVLLGKIVGGASGCTTLLITEEGTGTLGGFPWTGVEEFVAYGVIKFSIVPAGEARVRYIEITKMRGTNHQMGPIPIDIGPRGIRIVHPHVRGNPA